MRKSLCMVALLCVSTWSMAQQNDYVIVVHGGAGAMRSIEDDAVRKELYYASLDSALTAGVRVAETGADGVDIVKAVIHYFEGCPLFNSGIGATVAADGTFQLDASIMKGVDLSAGAVTGVKHVKHPIDAAYAVMTQTPHVMLAAEGADAFAVSVGLDTVADNLYFATPKTMKWVEKFKEESRKNGTVGCVVLDRNGNLTAGTSTGGMLRKKWGRVGDSPIIGAGTYADNAGCAVSCTGHGEYFIRHVVAYNLNARMKYAGQSLEDAAHQILFDELNTNEGNGGFVAIDHDGNITMQYNSEAMFRGFAKKVKNGKLTKMVGIAENMVER